MALIVEDGTGLSDAESYISVADADTYNTKYVADATWTAASTANKEAALRQGTQYLDLKYNVKWKGVRIEEDMSLAWPRYDVTDHDGLLLDSDEVPTAIEHATAEMAIKILGGEEVFVDQSNPGTVARELNRVGPITNEVEYLGGNSPIKSYTKVENMVRDLIASGGTLQRS